MKHDPAQHGDDCRHRGPYRHQRGGVACDNAPRLTLGLGAVSGVVYVRPRLLGFGLTAGRIPQAGCKVVTNEFVRRWPRPLARVVPRRS